MIYFYVVDTRKWGFFKKIFSYTWWIKVFTNFDRPKNLEFWQIPSHVSIGSDKTVTNITLIFESNLLQTISPYDNPPIEFEFLSKHKPVNDAGIFWSIASREVNRGYAILQIIDFIRATFYQFFLKRDPKNVWFPKSSVCSEIGWTHCNEYSRRYDLPNLGNQIRKYNSNLMSPMRLLNACLFADKKGEMILLKDKIGVKK